MNKPRPYVSIFLFVLFSACDKTGTSCQNCNSNCSHKAGEISGNWKLEMSGSYSAPNHPNPDWVNADPGKPVTLEFKNDSLFSFNDNYSWKSDSFDRYKIIDSADFEIYSEIPNQSHPASVKVLNTKEIEITYMGVDQGTIEKYSCY